jgi:hypothetical protein
VTFCFFIVTSPTDAPMDADDDAGRECAICLAIPDVLDVAHVDACLHAFHARCLARWSTFTAPGARTRCPVCKTPFERALTTRGLDGRPRADGSLREEPMCLLARARWCGEDGGAGEGWESDGDEADDGDDADADAADEAEALAMRGRARLVIGNRRFGRGGFVSGGGRRYARPVVGREGKGASARGDEASSSSSPKTPKPPTPARASREDRIAGSPSDEKDASTSATRSKGPKSAKRAESKARKVEKEAAKAAVRLKRREEEAVAAAARKAAAAARAEAEATRLAMESLRVDSEPAPVTS